MKKLILSLMLALATVCGVAQNHVSVSVNLTGRKTAGALQSIKINPATVLSGLEGIVVVSIWVDQYGTVKKAEAGADGTTVTDHTIWAAARSAAMSTHFNMSADAPTLQEGTMTYKFSIPLKETIEHPANQEHNLSGINPQSMFTFRGVPIDGSKEYIEKQLIALGYRKEYSSAEYFEGEFNGEDVKVYIHTHMGIVDRIKVEFPYERDDVARVKYNNLISRFARNDKFTSLVTTPKITTEIDSKKVSKNLYDATYFQLTEGTNISSWRAEVNSKVGRMIGTTVDKISHEELEECLNGLSSALLSKVVGVVWLSFESFYPLYRVVLYYDNLNNRPRGEDL